MACTREPAMTWARPKGNSPAVFAETMPRSDTVWLLRKRNRRRACSPFVTGQLWNQEPLPRAVGADHLTAALLRSGVLREGCVNKVAVENSRPRLLSRIIRLSLSPECPRSKAAY